MIIVPPTNLGKFLRELQKTTGEIAEQIATARDLIEQNQGGERLLQQLTRYMEGGTDLSGYAFDTRWFVNIAVRRLQLGEIEQSIKDTFEFGVNFVTYVQNWTGYAEDINVEEQKFLSVMNTFDAAAEQYGFTPDDPANEQDDEYVAARHLASALSLLGDAFTTARNNFPKAHKTLASWSSLRNSLDPHKWRPKHREVETLWHASLFAQSLGEIGFSSERPTERKGLGAFGTLNTISVTAEKDVALEAAQTFLTVWDIAHRVVTASDILQTMSAEGLSDHYDFRPHFGDKEVSTLTEPLDVLNLFRLYLYATKEHSNPVFVNLEDLITAAAMVKREDIGVVECVTRLSDDVEFFHGEAEFRVLPDHIASVKRCDDTITGIIRPQAHDTQLDYPIAGQTPT